MEFLQLLLRELTDDDACENILRFWLYPAMEEKLSCANSKLDELLEVHKDYPMTTNTQFVSQRPGRKQSSRHELLDDPALKAIWDSGEKVSMDQISHVLSTISIKPAPDLDMIAAEEAYDNMNAYYEVGLEEYSHKL